MNFMKCNINFDLLNLSNEIALIVILILIFEYECEL